MENMRGWRYRLFVLFSILLPLSIAIIHPSNLRPFEWFAYREPTAYETLIVAILLQIFIATILVIRTAKRWED